MEGGLKREQATCRTPVLALLTPAWLRTSHATSPLTGVLICKIRDLLGFANPSVLNFFVTLPFYQRTDNNWVSGVQTWVTTVWTRSSHIHIATLKVLFITPTPVIRQRRHHSWIAKLSEKQRLSNSIAARNLIRSEKFPSVIEEKGFTEIQLISPVTKPTSTRKVINFPGILQFIKQSPSP